MAEALDYGTPVKPGTEWDDSPQPVVPPVPAAAKPPSAATLGSALRTTKPVVAPKLPTGAPPEFPIPLSEQTFDETVKNPLQALRVAQTDPATSQINQLRLSLLAGKTESQAKEQEAKNAVLREEERTKFSEQYVKDAQNEARVRQSKIQEASPFAPTQESARDLASIFSLLSVAAFGSGGKGKYAGMQALSAMTGAMKGYKEGQKTIYDKEVKVFEENLQVIKSHNEKVERIYRDAMDLLSKNKEAGEQKIKELQAIDNTGIIAQLARSHKYQQLGEAIKVVGDATQKAQDKVDALKESHENQQRTFRHAEQMARERVKAEREIAQLRADAKLTQVGDAVSYVKKFTGGVVDKKVAPELLLQARALGDAYGLKDEVAKHPEWVGRSGQVANFFNRTIESVNAGTPSPDDRGQPELIFAKRYAEYLVNYERSLAGGAKGFTVAFQKRFNALLEQNQFNATGFANLMDEQMRTITNNASSTAPSVNRQNLTDMALDIKTRAGEEDTADAIRAGMARNPLVGAPKGAGTKEDPIKLD